MTTEPTPTEPTPTTKTRLGDLAVPLRRVLAVFAAILGAGLAAGAIPDSWVVVVTTVLAIATALGVYRAPDTGKHTSS